MITKQQLKQLRVKYSQPPFQISPDETEEGFYIRIRENGTTIGKIEVERVDDAMYEMVQVECVVEGLGKLLYYLALDRLHRKGAWLMPDSDGITAFAKRIWDAFEKLDYVEVMDLPQKYRNKLTVLKEGESLVEIACKFTFR